MTDCTPPRASAEVTDRPEPGEDSAKVHRCEFLPAQFVDEGQRLLEQALEVAEVVEAMVNDLRALERSLSVLDLAYRRPHETLSAADQRWGNVIDACRVLDIAEALMAISGKAADPSGVVPEERDTEWCTASLRRRFDRPEIGKGSLWQTYRRSVASPWCAGDHTRPVRIEKTVDVTFESRSLRGVCAICGQSVALVGADEKEQLCAPHRAP